MQPNAKGASHGTGHCCRHREWRRRRRPERRRHPFRSRACLVHRQAEPDRSFWSVAAFMGSEGAGWIRRETQWRLGAEEGQQDLQPQSTTRYRLDAVALGATRSLRTITVNVDVARCEQESLFRPDVTIKGLLTSQVQNQAGIYFNSDRQVIFTPGTIRFRLNLGQSINNFPDPEIKID